MLKIRLRRMGGRNRPFYRVVLSDSRKVPGAPAIEELGYYDARQSPKELVLKQDRIEHWVGCGAQMSDTIKALVAKQASGGFTASVAAPKLSAKAKAKAAAAAKASAQEAAKAAEAPVVAEAPAEAPAEEAAASEATAAEAVAEVSAAPAEDSAPAADAPEAVAEEVPAEVEEASAKDEASA